MALKTDLTGHFFAITVIQNAKANIESYEPHRFSHNWTHSEVLLATEVFYNWIQTWSSRVAKFRTGEIALHSLLSWYSPPLEEIEVNLTHHTKPQTIKETLLLMILKES